MWIFGSIVEPAPTFLIGGIADDRHRREDALLNPILGLVVFCCHRENRLADIRFEIYHRHLGAPPIYARVIL